MEIGVGRYLQLEGEPGGVVRVRDVDPLHADVSVLVQPSAVRQLAEALLAFAPAVAGDVASDARVARLREALKEAHRWSGCGDEPGTCPDVCRICKALAESARG